MEYHEILSHRQVPVPGTFDSLHICNQQPSFTQVLRAVKRQEHGLLNCIASIVHDSRFVDDIADLFPGLPLLANLRCGLWYSPCPADTCYFKSTDGHSGQWAFSTTRLNLHVAAAAARHGGTLIVDATRRGKTFPDSLTKTVPIWAAVLNRAVLLLRGGPSEATAKWEDDVHLPPWISANEQNQIRQRLGAMADGLVQVGADLAELAATLTKPLRCLWVSQEGSLRQAGPPDLASLSFTPIVLISASLPNARTRRRLRLEELQPPLDVMYEYVPGAGDDEESWARGLTPPALWAHYGELLRAGPGGVAAVVRRIMNQQQRAGASLPAARSGGGSLYHVGTTRLAVGQLTACASSATWQQQADAVLDVSRAQHPSMAGEAGTAAREVAGGSLVVDGLCTRYMRLPLSSSKGDKHALMRCLPAAVQFASHHLSSSRRVLIVHGSDGIAAAVCTLLACLLACFAIEVRDGRSELRWCHPAAVDVDTVALRPVASPFSRVTVRQYLAALAPHLPQAVPSKGMLKQVYNAFLPARMTAPR